MLSATASKTVLNLSSLSPIKRVEVGRIWSEGLEEVLLAEPADSSLGVKLLADVRQVFDENGVDRLFHPGIADSTYIAASSYFLIIASS